jgi:DNA-binding CsgD family transcriptional regulator
MEATCATIIVDAACRILWLNYCPADLPKSEVVARHPWEFLVGAEAEKLQAALLRVLMDQAPEQIDFWGERIGHWRAWLYFVPLREIRLTMLIRKIPKGILEMNGMDLAICRHLAAGLGSKEIAKRMTLTTRTVENHRLQISSRLGIQRKSLVSWCGEFREWL